MSQVLDMDLGQFIFYFRLRHTQTFNEQLQIQDLTDKLARKIKEKANRSELFFDKILIKTKTQLKTIYFSFQKFDLVKIVWRQTFQGTTF